MKKRSKGEKWRFQGTSNKPSIIRRRSALSWAQGGAIDNAGKNNGIFFTSLHIFSHFFSEVVLFSLHQGGKIFSFCVLVAPFFDIFLVDFFLSLALLKKKVLTLSPKIKRMVRLFDLPRFFSVARKKKITAGSTQSFFLLTCPELSEKKSVWLKFFKRTEIWFPLLIFCASRTLFTMLKQKRRMATMPLFSERKSLKRRERRKNSAFCESFRLPERRKEGIR